jgi:hypothetical protein
MRLLVVSVVLLNAFSLSAQEEILHATDSLSVDDRPRDSLRSQYIQRFPDYFFVYPVLKRRGLSFELTRPDKSAQLTYKPNSTYSLGMGVYLFEVGLELGYAIPLGEQSIARFGESVARDIQLTAFARRWGVDAFYQRYSGFYIDDKEYQPLVTEPYPHRQDIATKNFGVTGHYLFNSRKFSFRAAYNFAERQFHSHGSFLMLAALNSFRVAADSSIVSANRKAEFGPAVDFERLRYTTFSIAPGYTYNLTYHYFFLNATLGFGPAHHWINYQLEGSNATHHDIAINSFFGSRLAVGYNGDRIFGGISFLSQGSRLKFHDATFSNNNSVFKMLVGYRFREVGILKKRVIDLLPFTF